MTDQAYADSSDAPVNDDFLERVVGAIGSALVVCGPAGEVLVWNSGACRLLGWAAPDALGHSLGDLDLDRLDDVAKDVRTAPDARKTVERELLLDRPDGTFVTVQAQVSRMRGGPSAGVVIVLSDLALQIRTQQELRATEERARLLLQHSADVVAIMDPDGTITFMNAGITDLAGWDVEDLIGTSAFDLVHADDQQRTMEALADVMDQRCDNSPLTFRFRTKSGDHRVMEGRAVHLPQERNLLVALHDVTERVLAETELAHRATHDSLTGLPNRALFVDRVQHHVEHARRHGLAVAVMFWDVDEFKSVNDLGGHAVGDQLLVEVARRASQVVRAEDSIARFGGDEFVACAEVASEAQACALAERLLESMAIDVNVQGGGAIKVSASIGVAYGQGASAERLLVDADRAMYGAKRHGGAAITVLRVGEEPEVCDGE